MLFGARVPARACGANSIGDEGSRPVPLAQTPDQRLNQRLNREKQMTKKTRGRFLPDFSTQRLKSDAA